MNELDNPLWSSLNGAHAAFASGSDSLKVYPWEMVPFAAVPEPDMTLDEALLDEALGERPFVYFLGALPRVSLKKYELIPYQSILQMVCATLQAPPVTSKSEIRLLETQDVPKMIELTQRVYPAYFRERTIELGEYLGVFDGDALVAMAGLRMAPHGHRELSGVCTDPAYAGRGYAGLLCSRLVTRVEARGERAMLHFDLDNARARRLYEALGFVERAEIAMCRVSRAGKRCYSDANILISS